jgi:PQQ-dependent dehydrogenase (methanol/ethanol family)
VRPSPPVWQDCLLRYIVENVNVTNGLYRHRACGVADDSEGGLVHQARRQGGKHAVSTKLAAVLTLTTLSIPICASGQAGDQASSYTKAQSATGKLLYDQSCGDCHHPALKGTAHAPELAGFNFLNKWGGRPIAQLISEISSSMPPTAPGTLSEAAATALAADILSVNGAPAGAQPLQTNSAVPIGLAVLGEQKWHAQLATGEASLTPSIRVESQSTAQKTVEASTSSRAFRNAEVPGFRPVTDEMLRHPPAGDWLSWRRTLDGQGYSPLAQITRRNVKQLRLAWAITMREGSNQATPLVHDGIMYLVNPDNVVQAINAATGDVIWEYAYVFPADSKTLGGPTRNIAIYKDKLFLSTYDAALVALEARTGKQVWRTSKADYTKGYTQTSGPIMADGVVVSGINGCEQFKRGGCFVTGHDPDSGKELWRASTIALPGDPNDATWAAQPPELRAGGDTWIPGSYDPDRHLFYIGTAQAKPWVAASRHMTTHDAALYTDSTLALDPKTGKIVWYFQHVAGETLDMDAVFERVLVDLDRHAYLFTIGKDGILWKLDRDNGKFVDFAETVFQNVFQPLDKSTGRLEYRQDIVDAKIGDRISVCPGLFGGHNWQATAYSPQTHSLIIPLHQLCAALTGRAVQMEEGGGGFGADEQNYAMPEAMGMLGRLSSWDLSTMQVRWSKTQRALFLTGALTTAGGLVFVGDADRYFKAFDVATGELKWQTRLASAAHGYPITYSVQGKQYIAVPAGSGIFRYVTSQMLAESYQPRGGNALYVFELPK